jgi:hypothetical protein
MKNLNKLKEKVQAAKIKWTVLSADYQAIKTKAYEDMKAASDAESEARDAYTLADQELEEAYAEWKRN